MPLRLGLPFRYQPLPADPPPEQLAERFRAAKVHRAAARRIDDYERLQTAHREHIKAQVKLAIGAAGLVLGTMPGVPGAFSACHDGGWDCALRLGALIGSVGGLSVAIWSAYDLSAQPFRLLEAQDRISHEISRAIQCRTGQAPAEDMFRRYLSYSPSEKTAFKAFLHEAGKEPKDAAARWRQVAGELAL